MMAARGPRPPEGSMTMRRGGRLAALVALGIGALASARADDDRDGTLTVTGTTLATFRGWGVFPAAYDRMRPTYADGSPAHGDASWLPPEGNAPGALHRAVCGLGFDLARVGLSPLTGRPDGTLDPDRLRDLEDHLTLLRRCGVSRYVLTQWSPPPHMKVPDRVRYGKFEGRTQTLDPAYADGLGYDLADYLADVAARLVRDGFPAPEAISLQNEPDVAQVYDACVYGEAEASRRAYRNSVVALRAKLDARGLRATALLASEPSGSGGMGALLGEPTTGGFAALRDDPAFAAAVGGFAFHQYYTSDRVRTFRAAMEALPGRSRWMTEVCQDATPLRGEERAHSGDAELDVALDMTRRLASDFNDYRVNYWFWWRAWHVTGGRGYPAQDLVYSGGDALPTVMKAGQGFRLLWTAVRPGWTVQATAARGVDLRTDNAEIIAGSEPNGNMMSRGADVVAFERAAEGKTAVVIVNATAAPKRLETLAGLRGENAAVHRLTAAGLAREPGALPLRGGATGPVALPPHSVTYVLSGQE
jgi:hypothetical protein